MPTRKDTSDSVERAFADLLEALSLEGENFDGTPKRAASVFKSVLEAPEPVLTSFPLRGKPGMIITREYIAWSFCPHHLLPIRYTFKIGYVPGKRVLGLSKPCRIADYVCSKLLLQEEMAYEIVSRIDKAIDPKGCGCIIHGEHLCMRMRGIKSPCVNATSSFMSGIFLISEAARLEFIQL